MYLPPYSPDFNPIEEAFAKIKGIPYGKPKLAAVRH
jgi:transposase